MIDCCDSFVILGLSNTFFNDFFVDHDQEGAFSLTYAEFTALTEEHWHLVYFNHNIREEVFFPVHRLLIQKLNRLPPTSHIGTLLKRLVPHAPLLQLQELISVIVEFH